MRFEQPQDVAHAVRSLMSGYASPWCVAGGWAIDLFLGRVTRPHADLELAVFRDDQALLQSHLRGWTLSKIVNGERVAWRTGDWLSLPVHEIHACPPDGQRPPVEFLLNERDAANWLYRRNPALGLPLEQAIVMSDAGVPVLAPEIVLLFKAKSPRPKDESDFHAASVAMTAPSRRWLRSALQVCHPGHRWIR